MIGFAALVMRRGLGKAVVRHDPFLVNVRLGLGHDASAVLGPVFDLYLVDRQLISIGTAKQGLAIELSYRATLKSDDDAGDSGRRESPRRRVRACRWRHGFRVEL